MFQSLDLFGLSCLFLTVTCQGGQVSEPQNVSLVWASEFEVQLSWKHPQNLSKACKYEVEYSPSKQVSHRINREDRTWKSPVNMNGGFLQVSLKTVCDSKESVTVYKNFSYPEMVRKLECNIYSSKDIRCSWIPVSPYSPSIFYKGFNSDGKPSHLQACSPYIIPGDNRTYCKMHVDWDDKIRILFNETRDNKTNRNTYWMELQVKPSALNWTVIKAGDEFKINWILPDVYSDKWESTINYTECDENKMIKIPKGTEHFKLHRVPHCQYQMKIKAHLDYDEKIETPWSTTYSFEPDSYLAAIIITPLLIATLVALLLVCWRKSKNSLFPKVPIPRDLISDISDNNNKSNVPNLYIPVEEEENCKITLVVDSQNNKLDS